jgi:hypothetical protein
MTNRNLLPTFGLQHKEREPVVLFEYNLEDLEWILSLIPFNDGARKDYQDAINCLEEKIKSQKEYEENMPRLDIVVIERKQ